MSQLLLLHAVILLTSAYSSSDLVMARQRLRRASGNGVAVNSGTGVQTGLAPEVEREILRRVALEQQRLFGLLDEASRDINATQQRVNFDVAAVQKSVNSFMDLQNRTLDANTTALKNQRTSDHLNLSFALVGQLSRSVLASLAEFNKSINKTTQSLELVGNMVSAGKRVEDGQQALNLIKPRLKAISERLQALEFRTHLGNLSNLVKDEVGKEVMDTVEDMGRGFAASLPMPGVEGPSKELQHVPGPAPAIAQAVIAVAVGQQTIAASNLVSAAEVDDGADEEYDDEP